MESLVLRRSLALLSAMALLSTTATVHAATKASLSASRLGFGEVSVGASSKVKTVTFTSTGSTPITLAPVRVSGANAGDFVASTTCPSSLPTNASCTVSVTFKPMITGARKASVVFEGNFPTTTLNLTGKGVPITTVVTPDSPPPPPPGSGAASALAAKLGKPARLLIGLGVGNETGTILNQGIKPDIFDRYLVGVGSTDWTTWNAPAGQYVNEVAKAADSIGAVPMFSLYQMATNGDGVLSGLSSTTFMARYWSNSKLLFQRLALYAKPAIVSFEPDFWGYVQLQSASTDPTRTFAHVSLEPDCADLPNHVQGMASCLVRLARRYAPLAVIGFPPSRWGAAIQADVVTFMNNLGVRAGDFVTVQTLDGDAGCFEAHAPGVCQRTSSTPLYWDETNQSHPNFQDHFASAKQYHDGFGGLPLIWWQTPMGGASSQPGGTYQHYRDNRVRYFLTRPNELVAVGGAAVVFSHGNEMTGLTTDGGQFKTLTAQYLAAPAPLP